MNPAGTSSFPDKGLGRNSQLIFGKKEQDHHHKP
jgi:hypothetical protein